MNPAALELRPLHAPPPVWAWLPTPFELLLLLTLAWICAHALRHLRQQRRRRQALRPWQRIRAELLSGLAREPSLTAQATSRVIRKLADRLEGGIPAEGLTGEAWLRHLDELTANRFFTEGQGQSLAHAPFARSITTEEAEDLVASFDLLLGEYERRLGLKGRSRA